jgi:secreted PhoX family phosphatase
VSKLASRREILKFFGVGATTLMLEPLVRGRLAGSAGVEALDAGHLSFTPVRLPHPLPVYREHRSFLATGIGTGKVLRAAQDVRLASYAVIDDVVVPPEYERYVIVHWGDRVFPNRDDYVGYNADYTGFVPIDSRDRDHDDEDHHRGRDGDDDRRSQQGYLWVNHEYVSYPASTLTPGIPGGLQGSPTTAELVLGFALPVGSTPAGATLAARLAGLSAAERRLLYGELYYNQGGSVLLIARRDRRHRWAVTPFHAKNRRIHGLSGLAINAARTDAYQAVTGWGPSPHQQGDDRYLIGTGPAATDVFAGVDADGLGNRIIGTAYNCSGATTPWGTIMSAEENFQGGTTGASPFYIGVQENVLPSGTQTEYVPNTGAVVAGGTEFGLVGEKYGWLVEIDPADPGFRPRKHTALGRFRHENIALRVADRKPLVAYMGDDRRGGHTWKYVSRAVVRHPGRRSTSALLEDGTLHVARYHPDGTGRWIPLSLTTPTDPIRPSDLSAIPFAAGFVTGTLAAGRIRLPRRASVAGQTGDGGSVPVERVAAAGVVDEATAFQAFPSGYRDATLADFYDSQGAVLCDAFLAGNLAGGTPAARPEDLEVNPRNPREVFIAFTDGAPGGDGYPDSRVFQVAKLDAAVNDTQQSGGLYKIVEDRADGTGLTFRWERLAQGGEAGAESGAGFAAVDNLAFDGDGNVWGVTDMSTPLHNGFTDGFPNNPTTINHTATGDISTFIGVFGNNWLFFVPTRGRDAGEVFPFAYGPSRCEFTGPTFVANTLIVSVQHPGEDCLFAPAELKRTIELLDLDGTLFSQERTIPRGSNWPSNIEGLVAGPPRPCVIAIQRRDSRGRFI